MLMVGIIGLGYGVLLEHILLENAGSGCGELVMVFDGLAHIRLRVGPWGCACLSCIVLIGHHSLEISIDNKWN